MSGTISIVDTEVRVDETAGVAYETIARTGSLSGDVTITYGLTADTATEGADYVGDFGTVVMPDGASEVTVPIQILDDTIAEPTEDFVFSIVTADGATIFAPRTSRVYILDDESPAPPPPAEPPLASDYNVVQTPVVTGLDQPIRMELSPIDPNEVYVASKTGTISIADLTTGAVTPVLDLHDQVNEYGDRGILSLALHPDFVNNPYIYVTMVVDPPDTAGLTGEAGPDGLGNRYAELVRFTADASTGYTSIVPGSEVVLLGGAGHSLADISGGGAEDFTDPAFANEPSSTQYINPDASPAPVVINGYKQDYWKVDSTSHVGGSLAFGPDGALYVGIGDGTSFDYADPRGPEVQSLDTLSGKILRIDPMTGLGLPDNPFVTPDLALDTDQAKVFQLGLRNPFSIDFDPEGRLFITDTGWFSYEEINVGGPGANFGWPFYEGGDGGVVLKAPGYQGFASAADFYAAVESGEITITAPFRAFSHNSADPGFQVQAITGSEVVYNGSVYPAGLLNNFFFSDFPDGEVYTVDVNNRTDVKFLYQTGGYGAPTDFIQGSDGYVYYTDLVGGTIGRLDITPLTTGPVTTTIGSGADTLVVKISQDAYLGNAEYTLSVDGVQIGGTLVASAHHAAGESDTVNVLGDWAPGNHVLTVNFLNDAYGGTANTDRNLYVDGATYDGTAVAGSTVEMQQSGPQDVAFTDTGGEPPPPPPPPGSTTIGSGPDTLTLKVSEDAYLGDAQYTISVDGAQIGGTLTATAPHSSGTSDTIVVLGNWAPGDHTVVVNFLNDAWGGTADTDRNLYVDGITYDDDGSGGPVTVAGGTAELQQSGPHGFTFHDAGSGTMPPPPPPGSATIGTGPDALTLEISQDAYLGSAQYTVKVDGAQIGGTLTASALHSSGTSDTITVLGDWGTGNHTLSVSFLNDAYGGTPDTDRNLYIDGVSYDDSSVSGGAVAVPGGTAALLSAGAHDVAFTGASDGTPPPPPPGGTTIGTGPDTLTLGISEDAFQGDAQYTVSVDGVQIGGTITASALHSSGTSDTVTVHGDWAPGDHALVIDFLNDAWGGTAATDRNLYVDSITYDDDGAGGPVTVAGGGTELQQSGPHGFTFHDAGSGTAPPPPPPATITVGSGADVLALKISQDAYLGDAQYTVKVDGVQIGGTLTASALHSSGQSDTVDVRGDFASGNHTLTVSFLNDAYGGSATTDRNLYVDGITFDDATTPEGPVTVAGGTATFMQNGAHDFLFA